MKRQNREYDEQCALFAWAALFEGRVPDLELLFSTLNGVRTSMRQAIKAKRAGMKKGVPDVWLPRLKWRHEDEVTCGLVGEMKAPAAPGKPKGRLSAEQQGWLAALEGEGWQTGVWYTAREAATAIADYLDSDLLRRNLPD